MAPTGPTKKNAPVVTATPSSQPTGAYASTGYLPLANKDLQLIMSCSTSLGKEEKALNKFQKMRSEASIWRNKRYDPQQDRWFTRLKRYLRFFHHRKTASGWPITPFKFIIWAKHDARPTIKSIKPYLETVEFARAVTQALFQKEFPDLVHQRRLPEDADVTKLLKEFEIKLANNTTAAPLKNTTGTKKITKKLAPSSSHTVTVTGSSSTTSTQKIKQKEKTETNKKRKMSMISSGSSESIQPLWDLNRPSTTTKTEKKASAKIVKVAGRKKNSVNTSKTLTRPSRPTVPTSTSASPPSRSPSDLTDPFLGRIHRFSDLKLPRVQDAFLNCFRLYHPSKKSIDQEIEALSGEIEDLTSSRGELSQIASKEVLTICLESYLEFWGNQQISGFPIQAIKLCVWFDSTQVNRKEAIDIALGFERLGKRIEDQIDDHQPILFEPLGPLTQSALWNSFLEYFGWRIDHVGARNPGGYAQDKTPAELDHYMEQDIPPEPACFAPPSPAASIPNPIPAPHDHPQPRSPKLTRRISLSSIGSSLSSLPNSCSPLLPTLENSLESECIPDPTRDPSSLDHAEKPLGANHEDTNKNQEYPKDDEERITHDCDEYDKDGCHGHGSGVGHGEEFTEFCYKKAEIHSVHHQRFLLNLRQFLQLI